MKKIAFKICHWCAPTQHNGYFPHLWKEKPFKILVFALIFLQALSLILILGAPQTKLFALVSENSLIKLTNNARSENNLLGLAWNNDLAEAARLKAQDMLTNNYFAHTSLQGTTPWYWFQKVGYKYHFAGENLAMNFASSQSVSNAWLKSPAHRSNILNPNYSEIGIAVLSGKINGKGTTVVVEFLASPLYSKVDGIGAFGSSAAGDLGQNPAPFVEAEQIFSSIAPAFTAVPPPSSLSQIAAGSTENSEITKNFPPPESKTASLAKYLLYLPDKLIAFYIIVFAALLILTALNIAIKFRYQNKIAILHSGVSLIIILALILAQHYLIKEFIPIII